MKALLLFALFSQISFAQTGNKFNCDNVLDFTKYKGTTFLNFMEKKGKPILDKYANEGYKVKNAQEVLHVLDNVDTKVKSKIIRAVGKNKDTLVSMINQLEGKTVNLYSLPSAIAKAAPSLSRERYNLSTFIGLASCGGLVMKFAPNNYAYNIHYGTGYDKTLHNTPELREMHRKDSQTGRSFGEAPERNANDASDKAYLTDLEKYVTTYPNDIKDFYLNLLVAIGNSDTTHYEKINKEGQAVLTDFLAVYTAEQARNLMDKKVSLHWDAALLEVTLLSAFHAGQDKIAMFYNPSPVDRANSRNDLIFTSNVLNQAPCRGLNTSPVSTQKRQAHMYDYWQFSPSASEEHCRRSGINITKTQFRVLGQVISDYQRQYHPQLIENIERNFHIKNRGGNVFLELSKHFISPSTPKQLGPEAYQLAEDFTKFLLQVRNDAKDISSSIVSGNL